MYRKLIMNDIKKSKLVTAAIAVFILLAALLTSLAASLFVNLLSAIDNMMAVSEAPHLMYMHSGEIDFTALDSFVAGQDNVKKYQVVNFLNIEGKEIVLEGISLADSMQDNGFAPQSDRFDYLLDLDNHPIDAQDGEIYVPVYYMREYGLTVGGEATVNGMTFTIAGFTHDPLFNVSMASAKRFVVSAADYEKLVPFGRLEYLVEFLFTNQSKVPAFINDYLAAGMPAAGPPGITQKLLVMMNGISDGIMVAVLVLISILVIIVTFLCIRFTLLAKTEDDYREIGVLKAIGLRVSDIKKLYLAKYGMMGAGACGLGFLLSIPLREVFMENIRIYFGKSTHVLMGVLIGAVGAALIFLVVVAYVNRVLNRFRKISPSQAIRFGAPAEKSKAVKGLKLSGNRLFSVNVFLGVKDVLSRKKLYVTMLMVLIIATFIMIVPRNIYDTVNSRSFMTTVGVPQCDMVVVVQQTDDIRQKSAEISRMLSHDADIQAHNVLISYTFPVVGEDGTTERLQIALGDHTAFPVTYTDGQRPERETEIALSSMVAGEMGKNIGDTITVLNGGVKQQLTVTGIYGDITNAGRTAKALFQTEQTEIWQSFIAVTLNDPGRAAEVAARYKKAYSFAKVADMGDYQAQSFGTVVAAMGGITYAGIVAAAFLSVLITLLFMKMLVAKDRYPIAILKSGGFTVHAIKMQYLVRAFAVLVLGVVLGTVLANTLGGYIGVLMMSSFGVNSFRFAINPAFAYLFAPALMAVCVYLAARLGIADISTLKVSEHIKE